VGGVNIGDKSIHAKTAIATTLLNNNTCGKRQFTNSHPFGRLKFRKLSQSREKQSAIKARDASPVKTKWRIKSDCSFYAT